MTNPGSQAASYIRVYRLDYIATYWATVTHYVSDAVPVNGGPGGAPDGNWNWARITLTQDFANCPNRKGVMVHEIGHALGLAHTAASGQRVMRPDIADINVQAPQQDDINGVNFLY